MANLLLQDLMSDDDEGEGKSAAEEHHHHAEQAPLVFDGEGQVLAKKTSAVSLHDATLEPSRADKESLKRVKQVKG